MKLQPYIPYSLTDWILYFNTCLPFSLYKLRTCDLKAYTVNIAIRVTLLAEMYSPYDK